MSFFQKIASATRALNLGRSTAQAHQMAEAYLETKLPYDVASHGFEIVSKVADYTSVEQMAMIYAITYANRMDGYLNAVDATADFRTRVSRSVARACILFSRLQRSGTSFDAWRIAELINVARKHGVKTDSDQISFII